MRSGSFTQASRTKTQTKVQTELAPLDLASPSRLSVLTWNINGLDDDTFAIHRLREISATILKAKADVVCLQEVVDTFKNALLRELGAAYRFEGGGTQMPYYTMILVNKATTEVTRGATRQNFTSGSLMCRDILQITARRVEGGTQPLTVITSHLESGAEAGNPDAARRRVDQLEQIMTMVLSSSGPTVICGDFNLREAEDEVVRNRLKSAGRDPSKVLDSFRAGGSPKDHRETWVRSSGVGGQLMRARFDRQIFDSSQITLMAGGFSLVGTERLKKVDKALTDEAGYATPSDHFGILCHYKLEPADATASGATAAAAAAGTIGAAGAAGAVAGPAPTSLKRSADEERRLRAEAAMKRFKSQGSDTPAPPASTSTSSSSSSSSTVTVVAEVVTAPQNSGGQVVIDLVDSDSDDDKASAGGDWACSACTFVNKFGSECEICGTERLR